MTASERKRFEVIQSELKEALSFLYSGRVDAGRKQTKLAADTLRYILNSTKPKAGK